MFPIKVRRDARAPQAHPFVLAAVLGAGVLAAPLAALGQAAPAPAQMAMTAPMHHHESGRMMKRETVEQRIMMLHASLKITRTEEPQWTPVAEAMRENEASMQKLVAETNAKAHPLSAIDDLKTYERFTQAHVSGLKNLISSFETLYQAMPDSQKVLADQVFQKFGARGAAHAG